MGIRRGPIPADDFSVHANHWYRDPRMSGKAKGYMAYIATHTASYELSMEQLIAEMRDGRDAVYAGVAELVKLGYLQRIQSRESGRWAEVDYEFGPAAVTVQYVRNWGPDSGKKSAKRAKATETDQSGQAAEDEAPTASGKAAHGRPDEETPGHDAYGFSGSGKAASGKADTKKYKVLEVQEEEEQPPPTPRASGTPDDPEHQGGGNDLSPEDRKSEADRVLEEVLLAGRAPRSKTPNAQNRMKLLTAIESKLAAGWHPQRLVEGLAGSLENAITVHGLIFYRLDDLPAQPPAPPQPREPVAPTPERGRPLPADGATGSEPVPDAERLAAAEAIERARAHAAAARDRARSGADRRPGAFSELDEVVRGMGA